jgi:hypothetical protein
MKRILGVLLLTGLVFAGADIKESMTNGIARNGDGYIQLEIQGEQQTSVDASAIEFYAREIGGYSTILYYGNVPTLSAQAVFASKVAIPSADAQTITAETATTSIYSAYYKFTIPTPSVTRNVTINFLITK